MKNNAKEEIVVISLGGSLIVPGGIDWKFLKDFRKTLVGEFKKNKKFAIITGGGHTAREYQTAASRVINLTRDDQDWLGVHATRLNAHLVKTIFRTYSHPRINKNPNTKEDIKNHFSKGEKIMIAAGWRPGWSTDYVSVIIAKRLGAERMINLSNIKYVYDKDPKKYRNAKPISEISWPDFFKIVGNKWNPGLNAPFDPIASRLASKNGLEVVILEGKNMENFKKCLSGKKFIGTRVK